MGGGKGAGGSLEQRFNGEGETRRSFEIDLALQPIGGDASVVAGIIAGHPGEVQGPSVVRHPLWKAAPIYRGNIGE